MVLVISPWMCARSSLSELSLRPSCDDGMDPWPKNENVSYLECKLNCGSVILCFHRMSCPDEVIPTSTNGEVTSRSIETHADRSDGDLIVGGRYAIDLMYRVFGFEVRSTTSYLPCLPTSCMRALWPANNRQVSERELTRQYHD